MIIYKEMDQNEIMKIDMQKIPNLNQKLSGWINYFSYRGGADM